jgi:hypothetical protein
VVSREAITVEIAQNCLLRNINRNCFGQGKSKDYYPVPALNRYCVWHQIAQRALCPFPDLWHKLSYANAEQALNSGSRNGEGQAKKIRWSSAELGKMKNQQQLKTVGDVDLERFFYTSHQQLLSSSLLRIVFHWPLPKFSALTAASLFVDGLQGTSTFSSRKCGSRFCEILARGISAMLRRHVHI